MAITRYIDPLWAKQRDALDQVIADTDEGVCLFSDMGTGKTRIVIHWLEYLFTQKQAKLVYIVGPLSALGVWPTEWGKFAKEPVAFINLHASRSAGLRMAQKLSKHRPVICLINYESLWQLGIKREKLSLDEDTQVTLRKKRDTDMTDLIWDVGILDESTAIKHPGAAVSKFALSKLRPRTRHRLVMTGTAYKKRPLDAWAQVHFARRKLVFEASYSKFRDRYAVMNPVVREAVLRYVNMDEFTEKLASCAILLKRADMLPDLKAPMESIRRIELPAKTRKLYEQLEKDAFAEFETLENEGFRVTAAHVFSFMAKASQITSGFVYPDQDEDNPVAQKAVRVDSGKLSALFDILDLRDDPTLIVTHFNEEEAIIAEAIEKRYGYRPKILNGSVKGMENRHKMIQDAAKDRAFIIKESVGGFGIDCRFADTTIFYSHNCDTEAYTQMQARNHRGGQTKQIYYIHLLCQDTIDEHTLKVLQGDIRRADKIETHWRDLICSG